MNHRRNGTTIFEAATAMVLLAAAFVFVAEVLSASAQNRRQIDNWTAAQTEVANFAERVQLIPYAELTPELLQTWKLPDEVALSLPKANLSLNLVDEADGPARKRIKISIQWPAADDIPVGPTLTVWRFRNSKEDRP